MTLPKRGRSSEVTVRYDEVSAQRDCPSGGLRAIRLKNGWDDSLPPVLGEAYMPKTRTVKKTESRV